MLFTLRIGSALCSMPSLRLRQFQWTRHIETAPCKMMECEAEFTRISSSCADNIEPALRGYLLGCGGRRDALSRFDKAAIVPISILSQNGTMDFRYYHNLLSHVCVVKPSALHLDFLICQGFYADCRCGSLTQGQQRGVLMTVCASLVDPSHKEGMLVQHLSTYSLFYTHHHPYVSAALCW